jgi:DNA-binding IclR family transcriptional regulator
MTSPARALAVLDLFTQERPVWQPDEINEALGYTRATGYRYVKDLVEAGFLQKVAAGRYALGGRIIELDYQLRQSDPVLLAAMPVMDSLASATGFDVVLSVLFGGPQVIDVHRASAQSSLKLAYGRGRPRPLFRSGAPKILLSGLPRAPLVKLYKDRAAEIAAHGMGSKWADFRAHLSRVRKQAFYFSIGELEAGIGAAVVPVFNRDDEIVAAMALVAVEERITNQPQADLRAWLDAAAAKIRDRLA